jgi:hypothetical protein
MWKPKILPLFVGVALLCTPATLRAQHDDEDDLWWLNALHWLFTRSDIGAGFAYDTHLEQWGNTLHLRAYDKLEENNRWALCAGMELVLGSLSRISLFPIGVGFEPIREVNLELELMPGIAIFAPSPKEAADAYFALHLGARYDIFRWDFLRIGPSFGCEWMPGARRLHVELGAHLLISF